MQKLIEGLHHFQQNVFGTQQELFESLSRGQAPETLFITCSDSRINPNLLTQTAPGELFILRNAGNLVPPYSANTSGEAATIEFAVQGLAIKDVIICGHSHCGAMEGLLRPPNQEEFPALTRWLENAQVTRRVVRDLYKNRPESELLDIAVQENVLAQMENLRTHPSVASALALGKIRIHGWVYKIETGEVFGYNSKLGQFQSIKLGSLTQIEIIRKPLEVASI